MTALHHSWQTALAAALITVLAGCSASTPNAQGGLAARSVAPPGVPVDKLMVVDCLLPPQVRQLGTARTYLSARRATKLPAYQCEIRGGEYIAFDRASLRTSLAVWLPDAEAGNAEAQTYVGELYEQGLGTAPDYQRAAHWYTQAANQGNPRARINLGSLYERGLGVPKDPQRALNLYREGAGLVGDEVVYASNLDAIRAERDQLSAQLVDKTREVDSLRQELSRTRSSLQRQRSEADQVQQELRSLRQQAVAPAASSDTVARLQREIDSREQTLSRLQSQVGYLTQRAETAETQVAEQAGSALAGAEAQAELGARIAALETELTRAREDALLREAAFAEQEARWLVMQRAQAGAQVQASAQASGELAQARSQIAQLQQQLASVQLSDASEQAEADQLAQDLAATDARLAQARQRMAALEAQLQANATDRAALAQRERELTAAQSDLTAAQNQIDQLERRLTLSEQAGGTALESSRRLQAALAESRQELVAARGRITALEGNVAGLSEAQAALAQRERELAQARAELEDSRSRIASLEQQVQRSEQSGGTASAEAAALRAQLAELRAAQATSRGRVQALEEALETVRSDSVPRADLVAARADAGRVAGELDQTRSALAAAEGKVTALEQALAEARDRLASTAVSDSPAVASGGTRSTGALVPSGLGRYYALVIGNSNYRDFNTLATPHNDARALAAVLRSNYGFEVEVVLDATREQTLRALERYRGSLTENDNFLLYYAGHGELDRGNNEGNWLPVDAERDNVVNWISNQAITNIVNNMSAKHVMVIADSCYSGTLTRSTATTVGGRLTADQQLKLYRDMAQKRSRTVLTSGGIAPVLDTGGGSNSVFARALLDVLETNQGVLEGPYLFGEIFDRMRASTAQLGVRQEPQYAAMHFAGDQGVPFLFASR